MFQCPPVKPVDIQEVVDVDRDGLNIDRARGDAVHREQGVGTAAGSLHLLPNLAQRTLPLGRALQEIEQV